MLVPSQLLKPRKCGISDYLHRDSELMYVSRFGGVKHSGFGREGSKLGCDDYVVYKTVVTGAISRL